MRKHVATIKVRWSDGVPAAGLQVVRVAGNGTHIAGKLDSAGRFSYEEAFPEDTNGRLFFAGPAFEGCVRRPPAGPEEMTLRIRGPVGEFPGARSAILLDGSGEVPGLRGTLNPILDSQGRTYIYGRNVSFADSPYQPVPFAFERPLSAVDATGSRVFLVVLGLIGRTSLIRVLPTREAS